MKSPNIIYNVGIDIVSVKRFEMIRFSEKPSFYKKIFLASEIKYCMKFKNPYTHFAGKFALKEATKKALNKKIGMLNIETYHKKSVPHLKLKSKIGKNYEFGVSVSHENEFAIAIVFVKNILNR